MQLELKHLAPYLPYKLKGVIKNKIVLLKNLNQNSLETSPSVKGFTWCQFNEFKPILRPLYDLDKPIKMDENLTVKPSIAFELVKDEEGLWCDEFSADYGESPTAKVDVTQMNFWLFQYHFDVFGLIKAGLSIDINTLSANGS